MYLPWANCVVLAFASWLASLNLSQTYLPMEWGPGFQALTLTSHPRFGGKIRDLCVYIFHGFHVYDLGFF